MTWAAKIMPDDQVDPASLVGRIMGTTAEECSVVELSGNSGELPGPPPPAGGEP
jgi:hypothetical protein